MALTSLLIGVLRVKSTLTKQQKFMVAIMIFGSFVAILNQTLLTPALPKIMYDMRIGAATVQWLTTGFTLVNAIMIPVTAFLIEKYPLKRLFHIAMGIFLLGNLLCAIAPSFIILLLSRLIQAAGAGILQPLVMTVLLRTYPVERRGSAMGMFGLIIACAPAIGPTSAGFVIDHFGWRVLFYIIALLIVVVIAVSHFALPKDGEADYSKKLDFLSVILSSVGFGGLLFGLSDLGAAGVNIGGVIVLFLGIITLVAFFKRQLALKEPMLQVRILANKRFLVSTVIVMLIQGCLMAGTVLMPIYMQNDLGLSATHSGMIMFPAAVVMGIMSPISGKLFDKYGPRFLALIGLALITVTTFSLGFLTAHTALYMIVCVYTARMVGLALVNMPVNTWGMNALPKELMSHASSMNNTLRQVGASLGTAIFVSIATIVESRSQSMGAIEANIHGTNIAFMAAAGACFIGLIIAVFFVKQSSSQKAYEEPEDKCKTLVESLMKHEVFTLPANATVKEAVETLIERNISAVPLVNESGGVVGVISDGDILRYFSKNHEEYTDPVSLITYMIGIGTEAEPFDKKLDTLMQMPVNSIASKNVVSVNIDDTLEEVCRIMGAYHLKKTPVLNNGKLVGVISRSDISRYSLKTYIQRQAMQGVMAAGQGM